ncbi:hypothetical protein L218DRAFT_949811 [Marasmius fiardii PR-910]|nr:hypothetical protein L218DRAFT_949811 [Marasmius fiardii PR-910]
MSSSFVPLELVDNILKFCDRATITSCSLVCKSWVYTSHSRLFEHLSIQAGNSGGIQAVGRRVDKDENISGIYKINSLKLIVYHNYASGRLSSTISSSFAGIQDLNILTRYETLKSLLRFACSFPNLKALTIMCDRVFVDLEESAESWTFTLRPSVKTFRFEIARPLEHTVDYYKSWLTSHPARDTLHLSLGHNNFVAAHIYAPLCQNSLTTIQIEFAVHWVNGSLESKIHDLSSFRALEAVTFIPSKEIGVQGLFPTFTFLNSSRLRKITLIQKHPLFNDCFRPDAKEALLTLDEIFATPQFSRTILEIGTVPEHAIFWRRSFKPDDFYSQSETEEDIRRLLKRCYERGRLVFTTIPEADLCLLQLNSVPPSHRSLITRTRPPKPIMFTEAGNLALLGLLDKKFPEGVVWVLDAAAFWVICHYYVSFCFLFYVLCHTDGKRVCRSFLVVFPMQKYSSAQFHNQDWLPYCRAESAKDPPRLRSPFSREADIYSKGLSDTSYTEGSQQAQKNYKPAIPPRASSLATEV